VTGVLSHTGAGHLVANIAGLLLFLPPVGARLGALRTAGLIVLALAAGAGAQCLADSVTGDVRPVVGFSAATYAVAAAYGVLFPASRPMGLPLSGRTIVLSLAFWSLLLAIMIPTSSTAHAAHLGGLAAGVTVAHNLRRRIGQ
jgi:membrane associated rhomboid family serine protease